MGEVFDKCFKIVVGEEGGYVNNPKDPGGETKFGITKKSYPKLDIKNLTIEQAKEIYRRNYWGRCEELPFMLALPLFDAAVNCGPGEEMILLKKATNNAVDPFGYAKTHPEPVFVEFMTQQMMFKIHLRIFVDFGLGWTRRLIRTVIHSVRG